MKILPDETWALAAKLGRAEELLASSRAQADSQLQARLAEERAHAFTKLATEILTRELERKSAEISQLRERLTSLGVTPGRRFRPGQNVAKAVGVYYGLEVVGYLTAEQTKTGEEEVVVFCWRTGIERHREADLTDEPREEWT